MKIRLCTAAVAMALCASAWAGPLIPGLWEVTTTVSGIGPKPQSMTMQNCISPELAAKMGQDEQKPKDPNCTFVDKNIRPDGYSAHMVCQRTSGKSDIKVAITWASSKQYSGTMEMSQPSGQTMSSSFQGRYVGADCGNARPMSPIN